MSIEQLRQYQRIILNQALSEGIKRNEEQTKVWTEYMNRHKKVIEALQIFPLELTVDCMVPIGKRALMKGKLIHTNEVLVCLGESYFAKYSAVQAISLCNRRIEKATEMIKNLEVERNLYETRQLFPLQLDVFGENKKEDLLEYWDEKKLEDWRVRHRQKEKEYHQKLMELNSKRNTEIRTEEDLFRRLDELELEEELEAEMDRLEDKSVQLYGKELEDDEESEESKEEDSSSNNEISEIIQKQLETLQEIKVSKRTNKDSTQSSTSEKITIDNKNIVTEEDPNNAAKEIGTNVETINESSIQDNDKSVECIETASIKDIDRDTEKTIKPERKVSFAEESQVINDDSDEKCEISASQRVKVPRKSNKNIASTCESENDEIIRIHFKHSQVGVHIKESTGYTIESPRDIYRQFVKPVSILKRSDDNAIHNYPRTLIERNKDEEEEEDNASKLTGNTIESPRDIIKQFFKPVSILKRSDDNAIHNYFPPTLIKHNTDKEKKDNASKPTGNTIESPKDIGRQFSKPISILRRSGNNATHNYSPPTLIERNTDEEEEDKASKPKSLYERLVKDVREKKDVPPQEAVEPLPEGRPVSRFKMERTLSKK